MKIIKLVCALMMSVWVSTTHASLIWNVNADGLLVGAQNVDVDGTLYDVEFLDGSCVALFNGCNSSDDFAFTTIQEAIAAGNSLLNTVFVDNDLGSFDSDPALVFGCQNQGLCFTSIPFMVRETPFVDIIRIANLDSLHPDEINTSVLTITYDTSLLEGLHYARFSLSANTLPDIQVSAPATSALFLAAALSLVALRRRRSAL